MTEDEQPEDAGGEDTGELPPPSTWAGRARKDRERTEDDREVRGLTEEFDGIEAEISAELDDLSTDEQEELEHSEADEQEEPPADVEFEDVDHDEGPDPESEAEAGSEPDTGSDPTSVAERNEHDPSRTIEADTLALSDVEAAREAAHAGLAARAEKSSFSHKTTGTHKVPAEAPPPERAPAAAGVGAGGNGVGEPPKRRMWWRFLAAGFVIVASMATATAVSFLLFLSGIAKGLNDEGALSGARQELDAVDGGAPQTFLILGSDKRSGTPGDPGRSDTAMLVRVDPDKHFLSLMSMPRDLEVPIPGFGTDKLNAAYSYGEQQKTGGGPELAIRTIKGYLGIPINHVVNVDFEGFYEAVNAIDCVYIDVDHHYFHSNEGLYGDQLYSEINVEAGYQKLCGYRALQYVRYRHTDNDLVRGARQQDFIREARQRIPPRELLPVFGTGSQLVDIFEKYTSSDIGSVETVLDLMKTFVAVRDAQVRQVSIGHIAPDGSVVASPEEIKTSVNQFLGNDIDATPAEEAPATPAPPAGGGGGGKPSAEPKPPPEAGLVDSTATGQQYAAAFARYMGHHHTDLPIFYPTRIVATSNPTISSDSRVGGLAPPQGTDGNYQMYKFVMPYQEPGYLAYYGISGTNWLDPPILKNPSETRTIDGRDYDLYFERDRLRMVAWHTKEGSYWVNNTLAHSLSEDQMLGVATSTRELGAGQ